MRSKIHLKGHPLHPILVGFPIAFFVGTLIFDFLGWTQNEDQYWQTGFHLEIAGIGFGLMAAIPGIVDYFMIVPPKSSGKKRATQHGILNIIMISIFTVVWFYRQSDAPGPLVIIGAEAVGVLIMGISGWLGGTLVHRNQIGIDHRYAGAGKWKEKYLEANGDEVKIGRVDELKTNQMMLIHIKGKRIVVGRTERGYVAFDDRCTHRGASLADGALICGIVQCPWHGSQFDCMTGAVKAGPAKDPVQTYSIKESGDDLTLIFRT